MEGRRRAALKRLPLAVMAALLLITGRAFALDADELFRSQAQALDLDGLRRSAAEYAPDVDWTQGTDWNEGLSGILETGAQSLNGAVKKAVRSAVLLLVIVLLTSLAESASALGQDGALKPVQMAAALAITAAAVSDANTLIGLGRDLIERMELFSKVLLPTITAAAAAAGAPGGAAARQLAVLLFSDILMSLIDRLLMPLVYVYIAACTAFAALGNEGLKRIAALLKRVIAWILTSVLLLFVGYLTISGAIAGTTDALTVKAAKFTVSSMVPVVGGILSDAAETVLAGAGVLKQSIGVFGMLVVIGMCLIPFLQLGVHYLAYKAAAAVSAAVSGSRAAELIDGIGGAFGLVMGMAGACATMLLVSLVSAVSLVSS